MYSKDQEKKIQEGIYIFGGIATHRDNKLCADGKAVDHFNTDDNFLKKIKSFVKALSKNHRFDIGYWQVMNNCFVNDRTELSMCCPCGKFSENGGVHCVRTFLWKLILNVATNSGTLII